LVGASLRLQAGKTLAVVGESGSGKSTLARLLTLLEEPTAGALAIDGKDVVGVSEEARKRLRREVQIVFQNPYGSLNPRQRIGKALEEPLLVNTKLSAREREQAAREMMAKVGLRPEYYRRYPHLARESLEMRLLAFVTGEAIRPSADRHRHVSHERTCFLIEPPRSV
jgi:dipeptide transport system ATP-binding protein